MIRLSAVVAIAALTGAGCRSRIKTQAVSEIVLLSGEHKNRIAGGIEDGKDAWRWTAPRFSFRLDPPDPANPVYLEMDFTVPGELMVSGAPVTVAAKVSGSEVARQTYRVAGRNVFAGKVDPGLLRRGPVEVEFNADRSFTDETAKRIRSLIVVSVGLKEYGQTAEFRDKELARARAANEEVMKQRKLRIPPEKQREIMRIFHDLPIWETILFQNVRIIKNPLDLWMLQQIAFETRPDFIVETGTWQGGSALWWAHTLDGMGLVNTRVLTVDIQNLVSSAAKSHPLWSKYVEFTQGSSTDAKIVAGFAKRVKGARVLVNLDSDHSMKHVLRELQLYSPMVSPGGYMTVEDAHLDGVPTHPEQGPGPTAAILKFLADGGAKDFEQDFTREAFVMTSYPGGWLRRK